MKNTSRKILILIFAAILVWPNFSFAQEEKVNIYFFYGDGCPHCAKEEKFLDKLENNDKNINIYRYETWHNRENASLLADIAKKLDLDVRGVPFTIVGDRTVSGYYNDEITGKKIENIIYDIRKNGCVDVVSSLISQDNNQCVHGCDQGDSECLHDCGCSQDKLLSDDIAPDKVNIPFIGEIETKSVSLPLFTFLIAATDGFNPCAMWVLLFLISLLIGTKDRMRMWVLGSTFIFASGLVYFLFLAAWLNLFLFIGFISIIRIVIGVVALASGGYHLYDFWKNRDGGCHVTEDEKRKKIFNKIRVLLINKNFWVSFLGIIVLAGAVNLVELVCSAGLPAVYTQVLSLANLPSWQYYMYLLFYIFIFMLDDLLIFIIAMTTLKMKAISSRYTRWSGLIGGIVIFILGILLIFKPGWIMFG